MQRSLALLLSMTPSHAVHYRAGHRRLGRAEHLHRLLGTFDRDLVEQHGVGLGRQVRGDHGKQVIEAIGVVARAHW